MANKTKKSSMSQSQRFVKAARDAGCSEDEADVDRELKAIAKANGQTNTTKKNKKKA